MAVTKNRRVVGGGLVFKAYMYGDHIGRRVLVTGGTGFIGRHLVGELLAKNARVRVLVRPGSRVAESWPETVELCRGDLGDFASLARACDHVETVFHAAGYAHAWGDGSLNTAALHWRINAEGTRNLLRAATETGVRRFVFLSSVKAMGEGGERCIDEDWPLLPQTPYGKAKRAAEDWVMEAGRHHRMHVTNLRLAPVYGPGGKGNLERMIVAIRRGFFPPLPSIDNKRSMVHVMDVVQTALRAADHPAAEQKTYIVTDACSYSSREIYEMICRGLGKSIPRWGVPLAVLRALARMGDVMRLRRGCEVGFYSAALENLLGWACYRSDRIQYELNYKPSRTLAETLPEILREQTMAGIAPR